MLDEKLIDTIVNQFVSRFNVPSVKVTEGKKDIIKSSETVLKEQLEIIFGAIDQINACDEDTRRIGNIDLDQIQIINEFSGFIFPSSVKVDPMDYNSNDLLVHPRVSKKTFDIDAFNNAQALLRKWQRRDYKSDLTKVTDLRKKVSFFDSLDNASAKVDSENRVRYLGDKPFVPWPIKGIDLLYRSTHFTSTAEEVLTDYVRTIF